MNVKRHKISIAMTTYNGEKYIGRQIESLMLQKRLPDEIVVSDDASKDRTIEIVKEKFEKFGYNNYKILQNEENLGYKKNFYQSIMETKGDIIFLCDQDDIWADDKIENMEKIFDENAEILSLNGSFTLIDSDDNNIDYKCHKGFVNNDLLKGNYKEGIIEKVSYNIILRYNISPGCTMAFRKEVKELFLTGSTHALPHDWEINIIAAMKEGLYFYNYPVIKYRIHEKNTLGMNTEDSINSHEFKKNTDFRRTALDDRLILKEAAIHWLQVLKGSKKQVKALKKILSYDRARIKSVCEHNIFSWFHLVFLTSVLWDGKHVRFKTLLGDLYYVVKRE